MHPNIIGIGPPKCGTWWLYHQLVAHPQAWMPLTKEMRYFDKDILLGKNHDKDDAWYLSQFALCPHDKITGEITPTYIISKIAAKAINTLLPECKLFAILRNPIDRAISHWNMVRNLGYTNEDFWTCFLKDFNYIRTTGHYAECIARFKGLKVFWFHDIEENPRRFIKDFYQFVDIDDSFVSETIEQKLDYIHDQKLHTKLKKTEVKVTHRKKILEYYKEEITRLERYLQVKCENWK